MGSLLFSLMETKPIFSELIKDNIKVIDQEPAHRDYSKFNKRNKRPVVKGRYYELKAAELLRKQGWVVELTHKKATYINGKLFLRQYDLFGLWDIIAVKDGVIRFIQVSLDNYRSVDWYNAAVAFPYSNKEFWLAIPGGIKEKAFIVQPIKVKGLV